MSTIRARLAHVGIYAHDKPLLEHFYSTVLGLVVTDHGKARSGMELTFMSANPGNHHQLVLVSGRPDTSGFNPINQISFMVDSLGGRWITGRPRCG
jgi:catechol 2,3-dioxygenase-like lactoylglutathione lyase family enzyme